MTYNILCTEDINLSQSKVKISGYLFLARVNYRAKKQLAFCDQLSPVSDKRSSVPVYIYFYIYIILIEESSFPGLQILCSFRL